MKRKAPRTYQEDIIGDGITSIQKVREPHREKEGRCIKYVLIGVCTPVSYTHLTLPTS